LLHDALFAGDVNSVKTRLRSIYISGFVQGIDSFRPEPNHFADELTSLGYNSGKLKVFNPHMDSGSVDFCELARKFPFLHWPGKVGGVPYVEVEGKVITLKLLEAVNTLVTCRRVASPDRTLEIGAGVGLNGFVLSPSKYWSVDLPVVSVMQAYLLASALGEPA